MRMSSDAVEDDGVLPSRYVRSGENVAPPLDWDGVPAGAAELVLICEDLDAGSPGGSAFLHWAVTGLESDLDGLGEGEGEDVEGARYGVNGFGNAGYDGPEPPPGETHRYAFTLTAVSSPIDADGGDPRDELAARALESATLTVRVTG
jgi:Raf kinase inhibitor-like YbhB/YbcL family protein